MALPFTQIAMLEESLVSGAEKGQTCGFRPVELEVPLRQLRGDTKSAVRYTGFWLIGEKIRDQEKIGNCQGEALVPDEGT